MKYFKGLFIILGVGSDQMNVADLSGFLPKENIINLEGHENRVSKLAFHEMSQLLASCGYDGTVRIWSLERNKPSILDSTLVFHISIDVFGSELHGRQISHLQWSPSGKYIAAALDNIVNVWPLTKSENIRCYDSWFIEDQKATITAMVWPKYKNHCVTSKDYLLIGKVDGSVTCITVHKGKKSVEHLKNFSGFQGKKYSVPP